MTSTFTTNKVLELPGNGDYVDTWNIPVNGDMSIIDQAFGGTTNLNATTGDATLTSTQYRSLILNVTGAIAADVTYTIPTGKGGQWLVRNNTTGGKNVIIASGGGGTTATVDIGTSVTVGVDGTNAFLSFVNSNVPTGGGTNKAFYLNDLTITDDYTVPIGQNAGTFGPVTIDAGITVTVSPGSYWSVV
jgi:hypothetical protein